MEGGSLSLTSPLAPCCCCYSRLETLQARQLQLNPVLSLPDGHNEMIFALAVDTAHQQFVTGGCAVCQT